MRHSTSTTQVEWERMNFNTFKPQKFKVEVHHRPLAVEVARHEAGHYVIGRALDLSMGELSVTLIDVWGAHHGTAEITPVEHIASIESLTRWLERRVQQLYAGVFAQSLDRDGRTDAKKATEYARNGGRDDYSKAMTLIHIIRNVSCPVPSSQEELKRQLENLHQPLWDATAELVHKDAELIMGLGSALGNKVEFFTVKCTMTEEELLEIPAVQKRFPAGSTAYAQPAKID